MWQSILPHHSLAHAEIAAYSWQFLPVAAANVAFATAEFTFFIFTVKLIAAVKAGQLIRAFNPCPYAVFIPPSVTTFITAERFLF